MACAATWGHDDIQAQAVPRTKSGSVVLPQTSSMLMSITHGTTKDHTDAQGGREQASTQKEAVSDSNLSVKDGNKDLEIALPLSVHILKSN